MKKRNNSFYVVYAVLFASAVFLIYLFARILPKLQVIESILLVLVVAVIWLLANALNFVFYILNQEQKK